MEPIIESYRSHYQLQEKYVFYIIALCVSAIGFSVYCTTGKPMKYSQIPLLISVICWGASIFFGLNFLKKLISTKSANFELLESKYFHKETYEIILKDAINQIIDDLTAKCLKLFSLQEYLFYAGIVSFIIWHILEMYLNSK